MVRNGKRNTTKPKTAASATDEGNIVVAVNSYLDRWMAANRPGHGRPPTDIATRQHHITFLPSKKALSKTSADLTLPELAERIRIKVAREKFRLPWLKLVRFGDKKTNKACVRFDENVLALDGCETDYDKGLISFDTAIAVMRKAGIRAIIYTSANHTPEKPRWRLVVPFSKEYKDHWKVLKTYREKMVARLNGLFEGALQNESFRFSLSYIYGAVKGKETDHRVVVIEGDFLDLRDDLYAQALAEGETREQKIFGLSQDGVKKSRRENKEKIENPNPFDTLGANPLPPADPEEIAAALKVISADCPEPMWFEICCGLRHELGDDGFDLFDEWSATATVEGKYDAEGCKAKWKHGEDLEHAYTAGTIFHYADEADAAWRTKWQDSKPKPPPKDRKPKEDKKPKPPLITATPFILRSPSAIPVRDWIYGRHLIRKFGSATVALGGVGKSSLVIVEALAMVTGRPLLGITPTQCCRVWHWNGEDPLEEIERRITAACLHFGITEQEISGDLFVNSGRDSEIIIAHQTGKGVKIALPMVEALERTIIDNKIDVVQIDPFISSHRVTENDNNSIDIVAKIWTRLADTTSSAIDLIHHSRKTGGAEVTVEDSRGAGAMINAVRSSRVLNVMSKEEGAQAGVLSPRGYFRIDDGKMNLAPPSDKAKWYQLKSIELGNGPPHDPFEGGDKVAVVTQWEWPNPLDGVTGKDFEQAAYYIKQGKWKDSTQAKDWVGIPIARALKLDISDKADKAKIIGLLKIWIASGALIKVKRMDEARREEKMFIEVAED